MARLSAELNQIDEQLERLADPVALLRAIFAHAPVALQIYEASGQSVLVNDAFHKLFGAAPPPDYSIFKDEIAERGGIAPLIRRAFAGETVSAPPIWYDPRELEHVTVTEGRRVAVSATFVPLHGKSRAVEHVAIVFRDCTRDMLAGEERDRLLAREQEARREAEAMAHDLWEQHARAQAAQHAAEEANHLKDEFLAVLSHELRSPLHAVLGWVEILKTRIHDTALVRRGLETIERNAWAQARMVDDLLDVSRMIRQDVTLKKTTIDVNAALEAAADRMRPEATVRRVQLQIEPASEPVTLAVDADRFQQICTNLLGNGLKFTPAGGKVRASVRRDQDHVVIRVEDTGRGIPSEFLPQIWDRFRQLDSSTTRTHGGLGIGLSIVKHLAELHGGEVVAESPGPGHGAVFMVRLPVDETVPARISHVSEPPDAAKDVPLEGLRVMIVDDEVDARQLVGQILRMNGAEVREVASSAEALASFESCSPDILISDIGMPGDDGYSLVRRLRERAGGALRALALTGYASSEDREHALSSGFDMHLSKPVKSTELVGAVLSLGRRGQESPLSEIMR